jgi:hypothetical protein
MRKVKAIVASVLLVGPTMSGIGAEEKVTAGPTLQEITRDAEERLQQWDAEETREQELDAKYWWLGLIQLAVEIALGRAPDSASRFLAVHHWTAAAQPKAK